LFSSGSALADLAMSDPAALGYGFAALAFSGFALHLGLGWRGSAKAAVLLGAVIASAAWAGASLAFVLAPSQLSWTAHAVLDSVRIGGWLLFLGIVLHRRRFGLKALPLLILPFAAAAFYPDPAQTASRIPYGILLAVAVAGLVLTEQVFRRALQHARWAVKPLCLGLGAGFVFDLYLFADALLFGRVDPGIWAARGFAHALAIPFLAIATVRNRDWTIDIALSRGVVFHSTALLACGTYLLAVAAAGYYVRYFGGSWGKTLQVGFIFAALVLLGWLFSSGTLRSKLRVFINKHFFSYRYDYRQEWLRFTNLLSGHDADLSPEQRSIQALANLVESPGGAIWLQSGESAYVQAARWNMPAADAQEPPDGAFASFLGKTGWVVDLEAFRREPGAYPISSLPHWLEALAQAWLVVPVIAEERLIGFAVLASPRARIEVNWEVRDLLKTAARQLGSFLAQVQASEALLEARKFESFNKLATFVVHDLKNLVAQLSLLLKNAERHRHNPRFQSDMLVTVRHVEERMNALLRQLSTGSRGDESLRPIRLAQVAERVVAAKRAERADIAVQAAEGDVATLGYEQRFERVLGHLVQNAIDATREGGDVRVSVSALGAAAILEVADSGCGMSEAFVRERLFRPFQSTKGNGMGIGVYEVAQYAKDLGGTIEVQSRPGAGTRFKLTLPLERKGAMAA
jgi:putative PEP-CTERM system histidine kinase